MASEAANEIVSEASNDKMLSSVQDSPSPPSRGWSATPPLPTPQAPRAPPQRMAPTVVRLGDSDEEYNGVDESAESSAESTAESLAESLAESSDDSGSGSDDDIPARLPPGTARRGRGGGMRGGARGGSLGGGRQAVSRLIP